MEFENVVNLIDAGGTVALLLLGIHLGLSGKVVPGHLLEKVIAATVSELLDEMEKRGLFDRSERSK